MLVLYLITFVGVRPLKMDVFEDFLYIAMSYNNTVTRLHKFGARQPTSLEVGLTRISDLVIYQENKQYTLDDRTEVAKNSSIKNSLCLTSGGGKERNCMCGDGFVELKSSNGSEVSLGDVDWTRLSRTWVDVNDAICDFSASANRDGTEPNATYRSNIAACV